MAYLHITDEDEHQHLIQLFLAAHPEDQARNDAIRTHTGLVEGYFLSAAMVYRMATWARARRLITRRDAGIMHAAALRHCTDPGQILTLRRRALGTPPRSQPSITSRDLHHWLYAQVDDAPAEDVALTLEAACAFLTYYRDTEAEDDWVRARAQQLIDWLRSQQAG